MAYDPVLRHRAIEKLVTRLGPGGQERKYYRFRPARWYGGIVTGDCVGCGLLCRFCWVKDSVLLHPAEVGSFYTPRQVAENLVSLANKCKYNQLRVSGGEPTICKAHLFQVLDLLMDKRLSFILETNGIPIACDKSYAGSLSKYNFLHVRVSLKGCSEEEFTMLTGAKPEGFNLQLESLKNLKKSSVRCHPSVMISFSKRGNFQKLIERLRQISPEFADNLEIEELILYPHVIERVHQYGLRYTSGHEPTNVPKEQI